MKGEGLEKARLKHDKPATPEKREELKEQSKPFKLKEPHVIIGGTHQTNQFDKLRNGIAIFSVLAMVCGVGTPPVSKKAAGLLLWQRRSRNRLLRRITNLGAVQGK